MGYNLCWKEMAFSPISWPNIVMFVQAKAIPWIPIDIIDSTAVENVNIQCHGMCLESAMQFTLSMDKNM